MGIITSVLFQILATLVLFTAILIVLVGAVYVLNVEVRELTGIDIVERIVKR